MDSIELKQLKYRNNDSLLTRYLSFAKALLAEYYFCFLKILDMETIKEILSTATLKSLQEEIKRGDYNHYLIKKGTKNIGILTTRRKEDILTISRLFIIKNERKKGFGKEAIKHLIELEKNNTKKLKFPINIKNHTTQNILEKWNFKKEESIARYVGCDIFLYEDLFFYEI